MTDLPGARLMTYLTFRAGVALLLALFISMVFGRKIIDRLQRMQVGEVIRDLGLEGQMAKKGTPTMGGVIIILAIVVPCLLVGQLGNVYMWLPLVATLWLGALGFSDDYRKLKFHNKDGISGYAKIAGQALLGLLVGIIILVSPQTQERAPQTQERIATSIETVEAVPGAVYADVDQRPESVKTPVTTLPFIKNHNFDYAWLTMWAGPWCDMASYLAYILIVILVITATSNGSNLTDGLDGLCAGTSAVIAVALAIMAYLGGNIIYASYLDIMYLPHSGELVVFLAAMLGALVGFLWYNAYPAQVFMGDTGSLTIGGLIAVIALLIRKELLLPILCGIFFVESVSVILQVGYFKYTKSRYGAGRRVFKMTPLHHHFQKSAADGIVALMQRPYTAIPESKIVTRFWIIAIFLAAITFVTLKIR